MTAFDLGLLDRGSLRRQEQIIHPEGGRRAAQPVGLFTFWRDAFANQMGVTGVPRRWKSFWSWELRRIDGDKNGLLGVNIGLTTRCFPGKEAEP